MRNQNGSTFIGIVLGLTLGIGVAVGLALWLSKAKMPITNKVQGKEVLNSLDEIIKNKNWDPNAQLFGKATPPPLTPKGVSSEGAGQIQPETQSDVIDQVVNSFQNTDSIDSKPKVKVNGEASDAKVIGVGVETKLVNPDKVTTRDQSAESALAAPAKSNSKNTATAASSPVASNSLYSVQVGAFKSKEDASAQKARLALLGIETKITEVDQGGKIIYRVRSSAMSSAEAQNLKSKLDKASVENGLVKAQ